MTFRPTLLALALGIFAAAAANAAGDAERGKVLAYTCHGCHGIPNYKNAYPTYTVPKLGGQQEQYLIAALKAYASGERPHQTMHSQAATTSEQDRADIAAYLQAEAVKPSTQVVGTPPAATATCVACHGADGAKTVAPEYPVLAGQYADYIVQALKDYKSGARKNAVMIGIMGAVKEEDFQAIADFFAQQRGLCGTDEIRKRGQCK
jgi:cytochrome c553